MSTVLGHIEAALYRGRLVILAAVMAVNLLCVAALAVFVLMEKVPPAGERLGRIAGAVLIAGGALRIDTI